MKTGGTAHKVTFICNFWAREDNIHGEAILRRKMAMLPSKDTTIMVNEFETKVADVFYDLGNDEFTVWLTDSRPLAEPRESDHLECGHGLVFRGLVWTENDIKRYFFRAKFDIVRICPKGEKKKVFSRKRIKLQKNLWVLS